MHREKLLLEEDENHQLMTPIIIIPLLIREKDEGFFMGEIQGWIITRVDF